MWIFSSICGPMSHDFLSQHSTFPPKFLARKFMVSFQQGNGSYLSPEQRFIYRNKVSKTCCRANQLLCSPDSRVRLMYQGQNALGQGGQHQICTQQFQSGEGHGNLVFMCSENRAEYFALGNMSHKPFKLCLKPTQKTLSQGAALVVYLVSHV